MVDKWEAQNILCSSISSDILTLPIMENSTFLHGLGHITHQERMVDMNGRPKIYYVVALVQIF
jgi:hypothetical protein